MKIWYQLISSRDNLPEFVRALERLCVQAAAPGTEVVIRGTATGGVGDDYASVRQVHAFEIVSNAIHEVAPGGFGCYVMANSLDPGLDALRELLDVPVLSLLQVGSSLAAMVGDQFGVIAPNPRFAAAYEDLIIGYGLGSRFAGAESLSFIEIPAIDEVFKDALLAASTVEALSVAATALRRRGAEVVLVPGPLSCLLGRDKVFELAGLPVIEVYTAVLKIAETAATLGVIGGLRTSRIGRYAQPPRWMRGDAVERLAERDLS
jgi:allantoin racemase